MWYGFRQLYSLQKTEDIYWDIARNVEDLILYELERPLSKGKNDKVIDLMTDELGRKIMMVCCIETKIYSYLTDNNDENKKNKRHPKKFVIKGKPKFENYKHCFEATQLKNRKNQLEKYKRNIDSLWENCKEFIRNSRLILKS